MGQLPAAFDIFHDRISLNQKPHDRIQSAANGLIGCESRVWSRDGSLLAVGSSQLLCRPAPAP